MSGLRKSIKIGLPCVFKRALPTRIRRAYNTIAVLTLSLLLSLFQTTKAEPADPLEVKLRYVVLLSTFIRHGATASDLSPCMLLEENIENPAEDSLYNKISLIKDLTTLNTCKSLFLPTDDNADSSDYPLANASQELLVITDNPIFCDKADVFLFREGKRIFFTINIAAIEKKPFSLAAQVLALSKPNKCSGKPS